MTNIGLHEVLIQITTICPSGEIMDDQGMEIVPEDDGTASVAYRFSLYLHVDLHEVLIQKTTIYSFR